MAGNDDLKEKVELENKIAQIINQQVKILSQQVAAQEALNAATSKTATGLTAVANGAATTADKAAGAAASFAGTTTATREYEAAARSLTRSSYDTSTSLTGTTDAAKLLGSAFASSLDELFAYREELDKISKTRYDMVTSIAEAIGGSSRFYVEATRDVDSFNDEIASYTKNNAEVFKDYYANLGDAAKASGKELIDSQLKVISEVGAGAETFEKGQYAARKFYGLASGFMKSGDQIVPDGFFRIQGVPIEDVFGSAAAAMQPLTDILSDDTLQVAFSKRMHDEDSAKAVIEDTMRMSTAIKAFGITSAQTTDLVKLNYINTGQAGTDYFNSLVKAATFGEKAFGYSSQLIISDVIKMSNNFETFGFRSADDFAKIAASAHDAHLTISDLQGVMSKFNTFESAASAVGQLNAALGSNFDALELMTLKYEDPAQFIQRLREGFAQAGKTFEDLPLTYRTMITQQLGITMEALRGIMDGSTRTLDDLTDRQEEANKLYDESGRTGEERQRALDEIAKSRVKITGDMLDSAGSMIEQAQRAANRFENTSNKYMETTLQVTDGLHKTAADLTAGAFPVLTEQIEKQRGAIEHIFTGVLNNTGMVKDAITSFTQAINQALAETDRLITDFERKHPGMMQQASATTASQAAPTPPAASTAPAKDIYVSPGGSTVVTANFGEMNQKSYSLDRRDELVAKPPPEKTPPPAPAKPAVPALADAVRASLVGVGTSLRIELDVGQLTDLVLRDIMMNKPNVFGGLG